MEGCFWRATDVARRRAPVVLRGVNRHPDGDWATVAVAGHPGGSVRSVVLSGAHSAPDSLHVSAGGGAFDASDAGLHVDLGDGARADLTFEHRPGPADDSAELGDTPPNLAPAFTSGEARPPPTMQPSDHR